ASASTTVNQSAGVPNVSIAPPADLTCTVTSVTLTASSTTAGVTYNWGGGITTATNTVSSAGTYSVTVTDPVNNCSAVASTTVNSISSLSISTTSVNVLCNGAATGSINITPNGGSLPYDFIWDDGPTSEDRINLSAGIYSVTASDNNSCSAMATVTITEPPAFSVSAIRTNVSCNGGNAGTIVISPSGGTTPYTYMWNDSTTTQNRNFLSAGTYSLTVNDQNNCTFSITTQITQPAVMSVVETHTAVLCNGANNGSISLTTTGGTSPYTYLWNDSVVTEDRTALAAGMYSVTIADNNSCPTFLTVTISEPPILIVSETHTDVSCNGISSGSINIAASGGTAPLIYTWNDGLFPPVRTGIPAGNYSVTVSDNNSCSSSVSVIITEPAPLAVAETHINILCNGTNAGSINVTASGGTAPLIYTWNDGLFPPVRTGLAAGNYSVVISDNNSCSASLNISITEPPALVVTETHVNVACSGGTGSIDVTSSGGVAPRTYLWNDGITTEDRSSLAPAGYSVTISDNNACSSSMTIVIGSNAGISVTETHINVSCFGGNNAAITTTVTGGVSPYTYLWNDLTPNANRTNITAGLYTLSVTDSNSCVEVINVTITQPPAIVISETHNNVLCNGDNTGSITITATGGTAPLVYTWNDGVFPPVRSNIAVGVYSVTVSDNNSCSSSLSIAITQPAAIVIVETHTNILCNGQNTGAINITVNGGAAPYAFTWNDGPTIQNRINLSDGNYSVTVRDSNSCSVSTSVIITEPAPVALTETHVNVNCFGGSDGSIDITVTGGVTPYTFAWTPAAATEDRLNITAGTYSVTVSDNNSCSASVGGIVITQPATAISVSETHVNVSCNSYSDGAITIAATGGTPAYSYVWSDGPVSQNRTNLAAGNYSVTVNDSRSCPASISIIITQPAGMVLGTSVLNPTCESNSDDGNILLAVSGGASPYQFSWSNGAASEDLLNIGPGNYSVTVSDANTCSTSAAFTMAYQYNFTVDASPSVTINYGESTTLSYTLTGNAGNYTSVWSPSATLSCPDCVSPDATPNATTTYQIYVINEAGCKAFDNVTVFVEIDHTVFIPNVFTPNGDGNNDVFEIYGKLKSLAFLEVQVFNRWGEKVFESNNLNFKWDGTYKEVMQNPGVYIWQVKLGFSDGVQEEIRKGSVTIVR
ncbi:MAG: gliding motility-associated C-terminal domain-containing protein, partial [Bacteroidota bacterium]